MSMCVVLAFYFAGFEEGSVFRHTGYKVPYRPATATRNTSGFESEQYRPKQYRYSSFTAGAQIPPTVQTHSQFHSIHSYSLINE